MKSPYAFEVKLDPELFTLERMDALFRRAPEGKASVQFADADRERAVGAEPVMTELQAPLAEDV